MPAQDRQMVPMEPYGVVVDLSADSVGQEFWTRCSSVVFREHTERSQGKTAVWGSTLFQPQWLLQTEQVNTADPIWCYFSDTGEIGAVTSVPAHFDVSPTILDPVTQRNPWTGGELNGEPCVSHPAITNPLFWDRDVLNNYEPLPGWIPGEHCLALRPYKFHLIAMGMDRGAGQGFTEEVAWSAQAAPGTVPQEWLPTPSNEAGSTTLGWTPGGVIDGAVLRDSFYIYKETSCYRMTYVGGAEVMLTELVLPDTGLLTRNCIAELDNRHIVLTDDDVMIHDGHIAESVADDRTRQRIFGTLDPENFRNSFCVPDNSEKEIWVCYPEVGAEHPSIAAVYQARRNVWGFRDLTAMPAHIGIGKVIEGDPDITWDGNPDTWDTNENTWNSSGIEVGAFSLLEAGFDQSQLYHTDSGDTDDGAAVLAVVAKESWDVGDANRVKFLKAVWISSRSRSPVTIRVRVAGTLNPQDGPVWSAYQNFTTGGGQNPAKVDVSALGKFISVEFSSILAEGAWQIPSFALEIEMGGLY